MESVAGLRSVLEGTEPSDSTTDTPLSSSEQQESIDLASQHESSGTVSCDPNTMLFGPSSRPDSIDPSPEMHHFLLDVYHKRIHALFVVLHWPSTMALLHAETDEKNAEVRALRSAIYFSSICSLFNHELEGRREILNQYRQRAEQAFIEANLLTTTSFMVLQAFVIYLVSMNICSPDPCA